MPFQPEVDQQLVIGGVTYRVASHPAAPMLPYGQEGRAGIVYQLLAPPTAAGAVPEARALKVFRPRFRLPGLVTLSDRLAVFAELPGLTVCRRLVLTPRRHPELLLEHPDLTYAVLMPWITGPTWQEIVLERQALAPEQSLTLARALADELATMEERGLAHCDLSGPNVLLPVLAANADPALALVELVDVEQLYGSELVRPEAVPSGSLGYAHHRRRGAVGSAG
jgi:hypothetical protein